MGTGMELVIRTTRAAHMGQIGATEVVRAVCS